MELRLSSEYSSPKEILDLWKEIRTEVVQCLRKTPESEFTKNPSPGRWSISELGEHLYLSQMNLARVIPIVLGGKFGFGSDSQPELPYEKIRDSFIFPSGIKNPDTVTPLHKYALGEILDLLDKAMAKTESSALKRSKEDLQKRGIEHPILGNLNLFNWFWVLALHEHSHMAVLRNRTQSY